MNTPSLLSTLRDQVNASYGGDEHGLICAYRFNTSEEVCTAESISSDEAVDWLQSPPETQGHTFIWLHFNLSHARAEPWLHAHAALPEQFFETLREGLHSTRIERADTALLAVINDVHFDFSFDPSDISTLWCNVAPHCVVTARSKPLRSVDALRTAIRHGEAPGSPAELLEHLMRAQADVLVNIVRNVTGRVDSIEDLLLAGRLDSKRSRLGNLRRLLVRLQRLLAPEPAALFRLLQSPPSWITSSDVQALGAASEEFSLVLRDMNALQERIKLLQEEIAAEVNERNGRSLFTLTVVTVLALPINIIAGLFGMNVGGIPLSEDAQGFWQVVLLVISFTTIAAWFAFRNKNGR